MPSETPDAVPFETLISVDVETAGPSPSEFAMIAIGACLVDDPEVGFYAELRPDRTGAQASALAVSGLDLDALEGSGEEPREALERWERWLHEVLPEGNVPVFVGFNAGFDWMFVADYFHRYLGRNPFGHSALDIKSFAMGSTGGSWRDTSMKRLRPLFLDDGALSHNALEDARDQALLFRAIQAHDGGMP